MKALARTFVRCERMVDSRIEKEKMVCKVLEEMGGMGCKLRAYTVGR